MPRYARNAALEAAIIAEPLEPGPRMVYGDWLQSMGDPRGEWVAISTAVEAEPDNTQLRALGVGFLDDHQRQLLGDGAGMLRGGWLGWRSGFVDEIRLQRPATAAVRRTAALLAHPTCRFVRHVAIGEFPNVGELVSALVDAAPPLLESLLVVDKANASRGSAAPLDEVATLTSLRRLALRELYVTEPMPQLVELSVAIGRRSSEALAWILDGGCPNVEELLVDCAGQSPASTIADVVAALPRLRRLRMLHVVDCDAVVEALGPTLGRLELLDLSHSDLSDRGAELIATSGTKELVAIRTAVTAPAIERLRQTLGRVAATTGPLQSVYHVIDERNGGSWLAHRLHSDGRDALRLFPGAGRLLFSLSTQLPNERALVLLRASLTLPDAAIGTYPYANAAGALERLHRFDEAELISREGLLRSPYEPNLFSFVIDALRRSNRLARALALVPRALATLVRKNPDPTPHQGATGTACLVDCMLTLAQAGKHAQVIALGNEHAKLADDNRARAIVAISQLALGKRDAAKKTLSTAGISEPLVYHAQAAMIATGKLDAKQRRRAVNLLSSARAARYGEWHWIAVDPNLASLRELPAFQALLATPDPTPAEAAGVALALGGGDDIPF